MTSNDARKYYREAWAVLFDVVVLRNNLLRRLDMMTRPAMDLTPGSGMVFEFDSDQARGLLRAIDELTPRIRAGMEEVNKYAEQTGSPKVRWQSLRAGWGK